MKKMVQSLLGKFGFQLVKIETHQQIITGFVDKIDDLYRNFIFQDAPAYDEERIRHISRLLGTGVGEALYLTYYLRKSLLIEGDVCEFGVAQGRTSALMAHEIKNTNKKIWLFDSFEGLPRPTIHDELQDDIFKLGSMEKYEGTMACKMDMVKNELARIRFPSSRTKIVPGFIEKTIHADDLPEKVCFAYVDFDFYEPISIALAFLDKTMPPQGVIIVDDYDFFSTGAKKAVDEFVLNHKEKYNFILPIPSAGKFCILRKCF